MKTTGEPSGSRRRELFLKALEKIDPGERRAFLDAACGDDEMLRGSVEELLAHHHEDSFLEESPAGSAFLLDNPAIPTELPGEEALGDRIGRYKLLQKVGEGGCGVVYMAEQEEPVRRRVALKVIKLGMDTKSVIARFEAERQALALMDHPNIAKVLEAGATESGRPYFVMELVRGVKVTDYCDRHHLATRDRLDLFIKVCQAIQHAHQKGIIHRDIKPSNILVTLHDGVPVPKVIDFGIAKATTDQRLTDKTLFTALEQFVGTPAYMSPEQAEMSGLDIDTRSDIYSLGVLLYEMLTGRTPFDTQELLSLGLDGMRRTIREQEPVRPSTRLSAMLEAELTTTARNRQSESMTLIHLLRGDLDWIVMKCLEKDRARRYETANGLATDIRRHLNNEAVLARPPSTGYRFQKLVRRNKLVFVAAAIVTAALVLGLAVSSWQMVAARRSYDREQEQRLAAESAQKTAETQRERADAQAQKAFESEQRSRRLLYASDMYQAQQTLNLNNVGRARRLLERNRPRPGEEDLRGWEWRYLWQLTRGDPFITLTNGTFRGTSVSISPDGAWLVAGWYGGRLDLWDFPGRRWIRSLTKGEHQHHQGRAAFSPVRNLLAAAPDLYEVVLYDLDSGRESNLWRAPQKEAKELWNVKDISFSMDGSKVVIYAGSYQKFGDAVWVVDVSSAKVEGRYPTVWSNSELHGAARISPDNKRLYLARSDSVNYRYNIQCLDLASGQQIWLTDPERDYGLTTLAISPDGQLLASGSGFEDPSIHVWEAATGKHLYRLDGHLGWVCKLVFSRDGRHLISAASDQTIRYWDTTTRTETRVVRGHTDEVHAFAIESSAFIVSTGKDGNLILWQEAGTRAAGGYDRLPEKLGVDEVRPLDQSRVLLLPPGTQPEWVDLKREFSPVSLPEIGSSTNVLGSFGAGSLCHWDGNKVLIHEWRGTGFIQRAAVTLGSGRRPLEFAYNPARQLLAWTEGTASTSVYLASVMTPGNPIELKADVSWLGRLHFSEDGKYLAASVAHDHSLRVWNVETARSALTLNERVRARTFACAGRVLVAAIERGNNYEVGFFDLEEPDQSPRRVPGKGYTSSLAVSPNGKLVASATDAGRVELYDPFKGELIESVHAHLHGVSSVAFSPDGRRLISTSGGREVVKLWDVVTRQELLTFSGTGSLLQAARWSADGDVILVGAPWQAWRAPSWEEIAAAEAQEKSEIKQP